MTEYSLIKEFLEVERQISLLKSNQKSMNDESELTLLNHKNKKEILSVLLWQTEDKSYSQTSLRSIKKQISIYIELLEKFDRNELVDRNTNIKVRDYLFTMVLEDIRHLIGDKYNSSVSYPKNLCSTQEKLNGINPIDLINFFKNELLILSSLDPVNFILIYEYFKSLKHRLEEKYITK